METAENGKEVDVEDAHDEVIVIEENQNNEASSAKVDVIDENESNETSNMKVCEVNTNNCDETKSRATKSPRGKAMRSVTQQLM